MLRRGLLQVGASPSDRIGQPPVLPAAPHPAQPVLTANHSTPAARCVRLRSLAAPAHRAPVRHIQPEAVLGHCDPPRRLLEPLQPRPRSQWVDTCKPCRTCKRRRLGPVRVRRRSPRPDPIADITDSCRRGGRQRAAWGWSATTRDRSTAAGSRGAPASPGTHHYTGQRPRHRAKGCMGCTEAAGDPGTARQDRCASCPPTTATA